MPVAEIAGDQRFFEAITHDEKLLDCGIIWRTQDAAPETLENETKAWLNACETGRPRLTQ